MLSSTGGAWQSCSVRRMVVRAYPNPAEANGADSRVGVEPVHLLAHVVLPALTEHFLDQADELHTLSAERTGCGDELGPLHEPVARDPKIEQLARGLLVWRRGNLAHRDRPRRRDPGRGARRRDGRLAVCTERCVGHC